MERKKIGIITIGQSPRIDAIEDIKSVLKGDEVIVEKGALDEFDLEYVRKNLVPEKGDIILATRMKDGTEVLLSEKKIIPLIQKYVYKLEEEDCNLIVLFCTGKFPEISCKHSILIYPEKLVHNIVESLIGHGTLGVMIPKEDQIPEMERYWTKKHINTKIVAASPYMDLKGIYEACESFKNSQCEFILLDCMGYSKEMCKVVKKLTGKNVILSRTMTFTVISEI